MIILVDMDSVLTDYEGKVLEELKQQHPEQQDYFSQTTTEFKLTKQFPAYKEDIKHISSQPGFIKNLKPIPGSITGIQKMLTAGHQVFICTTPSKPYAQTTKEKYEWVEQHLGTNFTERIIITEDKTLIQGDILIDDKPEITGIQQPTWKHIIYTQSYNQHLKEQQHFTWNNTDTFLEKIKRQ